MTEMHFSVETLRSPCSMYQHTQSLVKFCSLPGGCCFLQCPHMSEGAGVLLSISFIRSLVFCIKTSAWLSHPFFPEGPPSNATVLEIGFQHMNLGRTLTFRPQQILINSSDHLKNLFKKILLKGNTAYLSCRILFSKYLLNMCHLINWTKQTQSWHYTEVPWNWLQSQISVCYGIIP